MEVLSASPMIWVSFVCRVSRSYTVWLEGKKVTLPPEWLNIVGSPKRIALYKLCCYETIWLQCFFNDLCDYCAPPLPSYKLCHSLPLYLSCLFLVSCSTAWTVICMLLLQNFTINILHITEQSSPDIAENNVSPIILHFYILCHPFWTLVTVLCVDALSHM
jgi:hypothetical protein